MNFFFGSDMLPDVLGCFRLGGREETGVDDEPGGREETEVDDERRNECHEVTTTGEMKYVRPLKNGVSRTCTMRETVL